jgi:hypothetical protein
MPLSELGDAHEDDEDDEDNDKSVEKIKIKT